MRENDVRALLIGGQACVLYGAAEFSRDIDFAIFAEPSNLVRLRAALKTLEAEQIAVPPFEAKYLRRGHAIHFRSNHPEAEGLRIDVMSKLRGVAPFSKIWARRTTVAFPDGTSCDVISLPDLVQAKKTKRDKDWTMLRRLVETHYFDNREQMTPAKIRFWFRELRTPELLMELAEKKRRDCERQLQHRPLLNFALLKQEEKLREALDQEEKQEREKDRVYWRPLLEELEKLRHERFRSKGD